MLSYVYNYIVPDLILCLFYFLNCEVTDSEK